MLTVAFVALALIAFCAPWISGSGASTSLNAYDLAEWSSLVPGVRYGAQPMVIPGLLRAQLMFMAALVALLPLRRGTAWWWLCGAGGLALIVAQLPPFEYFLETAWRADVNYGQQVTFALLSLIDVIICWAMPRGGPRRIALVTVAAAAIITALAGVVNAFDLAQNFAIPFAIGPGIVGYCAALVGVMVMAVIKQKEGALRALFAYFYSEK